MTIKVIVNGANGKMGRTTVHAIAQEKNLTLIASTTRQDNLSDVIKNQGADVVIDFTQPDCVFNNALSIIEAGARPIIGTSGLSPSQITELTQRCAEKKRGAIIAANFSIGAILMMKYAKDAAQYFPDVEIIEYHHPKKLDAPSGTAKKTAALIAENKKHRNASAPIDETLKNNSARGEHCCNVPIHSIRMSGIFANQQVIFSDAHETFLIEHNASDRAAMMPGVILCCEKVMTIDYLIDGMEKFL